MKKIDSQGHHSQATSHKFEAIENLKNKFIESMDDDFNTPQALACVFELVNLSNKNIGDKDFSLNAKGAIREMLDILGISLKEISNPGGVSDEEVRLKIAEREKARKDKNYALADKIRKELEEKGVILEDAKDGAAWRRKL